DQRPLLVVHVGLVGLALAHGAQPNNMPMAADRPGYRTATRSGDDNTPMHSHTALSERELALRDYWDKHPDEAWMHDLRNVRY
ncbi:hypothetical protein ABZV67_44065, partial [Streptomyces sp. NPDC005065]